MKIITGIFNSTQYKLCQDFFRSATPLWLGALFCIILRIAFLFSIPPNDYWWYLQLGQDILHNHSIPAVDTYTYTQTGKPYVYSAWLGSVLLWLFRETNSTVLLQGIVLVIFYGLIWHCCRIVGAGRRLSTILTLLAALGGVGHWAVMRPQLFSFPLFALTLLCLLYWRQGKTFWVWLLPIVSLLWINVHGAFPLFFLLAGAALVGGEGDRKALMFALLIAFVTSLINPYGIMAWYNVYTIMIDAPTQKLGPEWLSPQLTATVWYGKVFFLWLLAFPVITSLSPARLRLADWLWFLGFGWMALSGMRYMVWFLAVFAPINAVLIKSLANRTLDRKITLGKPGINAVIFFACLLGPLVLLPGIRVHWMQSPPPAYANNTPVAAVKWLKKHPELPGNLWADTAMSVYVIYALPERPVWADLRTNLFPMEQWEDYLAINSAESQWEKLLARDEVKLLLLDPNAQPKLIKVLKESSNWYSPYHDEHSIIFAQVKK